MPTARKSYFANPGRSFQIYLVSERVTVDASLWETFAFPGARAEVMAGAALEFI